MIALHRRRVQKTHEHFAATSPIPDKNVTMVWPVDRPVDSRNDHQSVLADQGDYFRYRLPFTVVDVEYGRVYGCKRVWLAVG